MKFSSDIPASPTFLSSMV